MSYMHARVTKVEPTNNRVAVELELPPDHAGPITFFIGQDVQVHETDTSDQRARKEAEKLLHIADLKDRRAEFNALQRIDPDLHAQVLSIILQLQHAAKVNPA